MTPTFQWVKLDSPRDSNLAGAKRKAHGGARGAREEGGAQGPCFIRGSEEESFRYESILVAGFSGQSKHKIRQ